MIPQAYILEWQNEAPWQSDDQIEQDLIISRIIVELYNNNFLKNELLFRGSTALTKLFLDEPLRYSEDLDFVQKEGGAIKPIVETIQGILDPWLRKSQTRSRKDAFRILYNFNPESNAQNQKRVKIEINTREHFSVYPTLNLSFKVSSMWFSGECEVTTYELDELAGTKLRALYQRKKGRDLFDLDVLLRKDMIDTEKAIKSFHKYLKFQNLNISSKNFIANLNEKLEDQVFLHDMDALIIPNYAYDPIEAGENVKKLIRMI